MKVGKYEIDEDRVAILNSSMGPSSESAFLTLFEKYIEDREKPLMIVLNTTGGLALSPMNLVNLCHYGHPKPNLITYAFEKCMSAGVIAMQFGTRRISDPDTKFMFHPIRNMLTGEIAKPDSLTWRIDKSIYKSLADRCGVSVEQLRDDFPNDVYLSAQEAMIYGKKGLIDEIVQAPPELRDKVKNGLRSDISMEELEKLINRISEITLQLAEEHMKRVRSEKNK
ncbi:MAG: ATP-dependent Clp protease proteolytic subunit [archaeon]